MAIPILTSRQLAQRLSIPLARWKRWSREFLAPDPLAGKQSGYARQYYLNDAFTVYLGGHLVSHLNFAIPEARRIVADLQPWLDRHGFHFDLRGQRVQTPKRLLANAYSIRIYIAPSGFRYVSRGLIERRRRETPEGEVQDETYTEAQIGTKGPDPEDHPPANVLTLRISALSEQFQSLVKGNDGD